MFRTNAKSLEEAENLSDNTINCLPVLRNTLIMPFNKNQHWCLCIAEVNEKTFVFIDPLGETESTSRMYMSYFIDTILKYNKVSKTSIPTEEYKLTQAPHTVQSDSYKCGVLVLMFVERIVQKKSLFPNTNPNQYRL